MHLCQPGHLLIVLFDSLIKFAISIPLQLSNFSFSQFFYTVYFNLICIIKFSNFLLEFHFILFFDGFDLKLMFFFNSFNCIRAIFISEF